MGFLSFVNILRKGDPFHDPKTGQFTSLGNRLIPPAHTSEGFGTGMAALQIAEEKGALTVPNLPRNMTTADLNKKITLYHGTTSAALKDILKNGLVPAKGKGGDVWVTPMIGRDLSEGRPKSVYMTPLLEHAQQFAEMAESLHPGSKALLLKLEVPVKVLASHAHQDEADSWAYRFEGVVPPSYIKSSSVERGKMVPIKKSDNQVLYTVVLCQEKAEKQDYVRVLKFNQNHDEKGRFSNVGLGGNHHHLDSSLAGTSFIMSHIDAKELEDQSEGSRSHPIECNDDIEKAAKLISEGKHVTLNQPDEIATLTDKIKKEADAAKATGVKPPVWNLADISVKGTNLFAQDNLGIPRVEMPQFDGTVVPGSKAAALLPPGSGPNAEVDLSKQFIEYVTDKGIKVKDGRVLASHLRGTQDQIDGAKVASIAAAMDAGKIKESPIFVTRDNYVIDGHHRWAATVVRDVKDNKTGHLTMAVHKLNIDIGTALSMGVDFQKEWGLARQGVGSGPTTVHKMNFVEVLKYDQFRDSNGRFSTSDNAEPMGPAEQLLKRERPTVSDEEILRKALPNPKDRALYDKTARNSLRLWESGETSKLEHTIPGTNRYTKDNLNQHHAIIHNFFGGKENEVNFKPPKGQKPTFIILGGRGGSGKTNFSTEGNHGKPSIDSPVYDPKKFGVVDADRAKELITHYDPENAAIFHDESKDITSKALRYAKKKGLNVVYDCTMKSENAVDWVKSFKKKGYRIESYYSHRPTDLAAESTIRRWKDPTFVKKLNGKTVAYAHGRLVPLSIVRTNVNNEHIFDRIAKLSNKWALYDNSNPDSKIIYLKKVAEGGSASKFEWVLKGDPYHDPKDGKFTSKDGAGNVLDANFPSQLNGVPFKSVTNPDFSSSVNSSVKEPELKVPHGFHTAAGVIMVEPDNRVWLYEPKNHYGGYVHSFAKGTVKSGEGLQETAARETWEETGLVPKIDGYLGDVNRTTSVSRFYIGHRIGGKPTLGKETQAVKLVPINGSKIEDMLRNVAGSKTSDHKILDVLRQHLSAQKIDPYHDPKDGRFTTGPGNGNPPVNIFEWKKVGDKKGSNPGGVYEALNGIRHYVKFPQTNPEQAQTEVLSDSIYKALDIPAKKSFLVHSGSGATGIASELLDTTTPLPKEQIIKSGDVRKGYVADAYLGNHDVFGATYDNIVPHQGHDYRIDNGGTMFFRAQGNLKTFPSDKVDELDSMIAPGKKGNEVYGDLTYGQKKAQAAHLVNTLTDARLEMLVDNAGLTGNSKHDYLNTLKGRRDVIAETFGITPTGAKSSIPKAVIEKPSQVADINSVGATTAPKGYFSTTPMQTLTESEKSPTDLVNHVKSKGFKIVTTDSAGTITSHDFPKGTATALEKTPPLNSMVTSWPKPGDTISPDLMKAIQNVQANPTMAYHPPLPVLHPDLAAAYQYNPSNPDAPWFNPHTGVARTVASMGMSENFLNNIHPKTPVHAKLLYVPMIHPNNTAEGWRYNPGNPDKPWINENTSMSLTTAEMDSWTKLKTDSEFVQAKIFTGLAPDPKNPTAKLPGYSDFLKGKRPKITERAAQALNGVSPYSPKPKVPEPVSTPEEIQKVSESIVKPTKPLTPAQQKVKEKYNAKMAEKVKGDLAKNYEDLTTQLMDLQSPSGANGNSFLANKKDAEKVAAKLAAYDAKLIKYGVPPEEIASFKGELSKKLNERIALQQAKLHDLIDQYAMANAQGDSRKISSAQNKVSNFQKAHPGYLPLVENQAYIKVAKAKIETQKNQALQSIAKFKSDTKGQAESPESITKAKELEKSAYSFGATAREIASATGEPTPAYMAFLQKVNSGVVPKTKEEAQSMAEAAGTNYYKLQKISDDSWSSRNTKSAKDAKEIYDDAKSQYLLRGGEPAYFVGKDSELKTQADALYYEEKRAKQLKQSVFCRDVYNASAEYAQSKYEKGSTAPETIELSKKLDELGSKNKKEEILDGPEFDYQLNSGAGHYQQLMAKEQTQANNAVENAAYQYHYKKVILGTENEETKESASALGSTITLHQKYLNANTLHSLSEKAKSKALAAKTMEDKLKNLNVEAGKVVANYDADAPSFIYRRPHTEAGEEFAHVQEGAIAKLTYKERGVLHSYTNSSFTNTNREAGKAGLDILQGRTPYVSEGQADKIKLMDSAIAKVPLGVNVMLRRNMPQKYFFEQFHMTPTEANAMTEEEAQKLIGKTYKELAFSSTSMNPDSGNCLANEASSTGTMKLNIRAGKDIPGVRVYGDISTHNIEQEVVLGRGTTYVIKGIHKSPSSDYGYKWSVDVDAIGCFPDKLI